MSLCVVVVVMHLISCHHVHCICIRVRLMHSSIFPVVRFAFRRFVLLRWSFLPFFRVWGLNISGLDRDLPSGLGLLPVDRLSSFGSFGLCLILQRLTEGPKRPRACRSPCIFRMCVLSCASLRREVPEIADFRDLVIFTKSGIF